MKNLEPTWYVILQVYGAGIMTKDTTCLYLLLDSVFVQVSGMMHRSRISAPYPPSHMVSPAYRPFHVAAGRLQTQKYALRVRIEVLTVCRMGFRVCRHGVWVLMGTLAESWYSLLGHCRAVHDLHTLDRSFYSRSWSVSSMAMGVYAAQARCSIKRKSIEISGLLSCSVTSLSCSPSCIR
jgi:hypothetical protein